MNKSDTFQKIKELGLVAVIRGPSEELTLKAVDALIAGGVLGIEVTFSTPNAPQVVEQVASKYADEILLGMGTLTSVDQVTMAKDSGAKFVVSPMFDVDLTKAFVDSGLLSMVGCFSPSEVFHAYKMGADIIKVFPGRLAGPNHIKDLRGPFPDIPFIPTGGVNKDNLADWFKVGVVAVGAGSSLCPKQLVIDEDFQQITEVAKAFVERVNAVRQL